MDVCCPFVHFIPSEISQLCLVSYLTFTNRWKHVETNKARWQFKVQQHQFCIGDCTYEYQANRRYSLVCFGLDELLYLSSLHLRRSVGVEKVPAGGRISSLNPDHLKPMRKRKRKEYLSPSEEDSDIEGTVGRHCCLSKDNETFSYLMSLFRYA